MLIRTIVLLKFFLISAVVRADSLPDIIEHTLKTNPEIFISLNRNKALKEQVIIEKSGFLPKIDLYGGLELNRKNSDYRANGGSDTSFSTGVLLKQKLFSGFETTNRVESSEQASLSQMFRIKAISEEVIIKVVQSYIKVLTNEQLVKLSKENLEIHRSIYNQLLEKAKSGLIRSSDLNQIKSRKSRSEANLVASMNALSNAKAEFFLVANKKPENLQLPRFDKSLMPSSFDKAMSISSKNNTELAAIDAEIKSLEYMYKAKKAHKLPSLDFTIKQDFTSASNDIVMLDGNSDELSMKLNMNYNLYSGGSGNANERKAGWTLDEKIANKDFTLRKITRDLKISWESYVHANRKLKHLKQHIDESKNVVNAYRDQFQLGKRSLLDLLDTENELFLAKRDFIASIEDNMLSRFYILKEMGQLIKSLNINLPQLVAAAIGDDALN